MELERDGLVLARRLGERAAEVTLLGNVVEDARRTGEWTWALAELDAAISLDIDVASRRALVLNRASYHALQGAVTEGDVAELERPTEGFEDLDVDASVQEVRASMAIGEGNWRAAHDGYKALTDQSRLNAPYILPFVGWMAVLAREPALARDALDRLHELAGDVDGGGRAVRAGIAALEGDRPAAFAGFRQSIASARELGIRLDEALITMVAISCLGANEPETLGWATQAADFLDDVGAVPVGRQLAYLIEQTSTSAIRTARTATPGAPADTPMTPAAGAGRTTEAPATS